MFENLDTTEIAKLRSAISVLQDQADQAHQNATPSVGVLDIAARRGDRDIKVPVILTAPAKWTIALGYLLRNGAGTNGGNHYEKGEGSIIFHPGESVKYVPVKLKRDLAEGQDIQVALGWPRSHPPTKITRPLGRIYGDPVRSRYIPSSYRRVFESDLLTGFEATDSGYTADGAPCWRTRLGHGRTQSGNREIGFYSDPALHGTNPFPIVEGRRAIQAERVAVEGHDFSAAVLTTQRLMSWKYGYFEARIKLPRVRGVWPAFWLKPTRTWPPEIDIFEGFFWNNRPVADELSFTQHWKEGGAHRSYGSSIPLPQVVPGYTLEGYHDYGLLWDADRCVWYVDGERVFEMPNMTNDECYLKLNVAVGGAVGSPPEDAEFPATMIVDHVKVYQIPVAG